MSQAAPRSVPSPVARRLCLPAAILLSAVPACAAGGGSISEPVTVHQLYSTQHQGAATCSKLFGEPGDEVIALQPGSGTRCLSATVFGYLPYWEDPVHLRYDLLTHIACFSVEVNSDGSLGNDHGWPWTGLINTAHANGVKVVLVATLFDRDRILTLITSETNKTAFFANIKAKMLEGSADGLNIDFEGSGVWRSYINGFMADLTAYLHAEIPGTEVTFAGPAVNWSNSWDLPGLAASCDGIFIMGYAFSGSWSTNAGPTAPLTGGSINITDTVMNQYGEVTQNSPEKLILGIPYYGAHWKVVSSQPRAAAIAYVDSPRFRVAQPESELYGMFWDEVSQTPWYRYHDGANWHQVWFDDDVSLGLKYELAQSVNLQGVGMWALEYDGSRTELWDELERQFLGPCPIPADFDNDGDVDLDDFGHLQVCLSGANILQDDPECQDARLDGDSDVDQDDFAIFQGCLSGANTPADPACAD